MADQGFVQKGEVMLRSMYRNSRSAVRRISNRFDCPVVILLYHRVTSYESDPHKLKVSPANFKAQMRYLCEHVPVLRFEENWATVNKPSVVVTFDDGYADNALEALPILEEFGIPATFFVATGTIGTNTEFWFDELESLILGHLASDRHFELKDRRYGRAWPVTTGSERQKFFQELMPLMKKIDFNRREDWMRQLRSWANSDSMNTKANNPMAVEELCLLAKSPIATVGAHGVTHSALSALSPIQQKEELTASKEKLEAWIGKTVSVFAYPYGGRAYYTRASIRICKQVGFSKAATTIRGQAHRWTDPYQIPRQSVRDWSLDTFVGKLSEFWT